MRWRMASSMSRAMKIRIGSLVVRRWSLAKTIPAVDQRPKTDLHQLSSHHIQRLLTGEPADVFAISGKFSFHDFGSAVGSQSMENQSNWFRISPAGRSGDARNPQAHSCASSPANSLRQSSGYFTAHCAAFVDEFRWNVGEPDLQLIRINNGASHKVTGASTDRSDALGQ